MEESIVAVVFIVAVIVAFVGVFIGLCWWVASALIEHGRIDAFNRSRYPESAEYIRDQIRAQKERKEAEEPH